MSTEERLQVHEQMIASIERNLGALVEAQQRTEQKIEELAKAQQRTEERVNDLSRVVASVVDIQRDTLGMIQSVVNRVEQLTHNIEQVNQRGAATDERLDRLVETVQRFLDSQTGRNGQQ